MEKEKKTTPVSDQELMELAEVYKQLRKPNRNMVAFGASLLLTSQNMMDSQPRKTG